MAEVHGFERLRVQEIPEINARAELYRHIKTGAELLSLVNDDENKVFGISFRTPPSDSTGLPHILEHSVLCGSRKYPAKEPFVELLKSSVQTFLNAMTYPDKTCYPVASQNTQDLYNLADVYMDAVFYPRITPFIFQQEGWHLETGETDKRLTYKGVVFSEMKGVYSSPDSLLGEFSRQALFPETTYGLDAGGEPRQIPTLTYEQFREFHRRYYHPSNSRIFFYGDDDPERRLAFLDSYLRNFERVEPDSDVALQPPFERPVRLVRTFAAGEAQHGNKGMMTLNWLLGDTTDTDLNLSFHMLEFILLGMPGSPLRKELIDSELGEDLAGQGLDSEIRQMYFSTGLKGIDPENADKVEELIVRTLTGLSKNGIDPLTVEAAVNSIEFALRENNTGSYPRGLGLMLRALTTWLYGGDPLALVAFEKPLERVKGAIARERRFFEDLIDRLLLRNPHRALVLLKPDIESAGREEESEKAHLETVRKSMSPSQLEEVLTNTARLKEMQETPDPPETLASIPSLGIGDLDRYNKCIPVTLLREGTAEILYHDLFTSGIVYLDLGFNLHTLPQELLPYVPLFGRALLEIGTEDEDYVALSQRISRKTGGVFPNIFSSAAKGEYKSAAWIFLRAKAMLNRSEELLGILRDVLLKPRLDNRERFRQMVLEAKARLEQKLIPSGHQIVNVRLRAQFEESGWIAEQMKGVNQLFFLRALAGRIDSDWQGVLADLERLRSLLLSRGNVLANVTLDEEGWRRLEPHFRGFLADLPPSPAAVEMWDPNRPTSFEGLTIPAHVNYVGKGVDLYGSGYRYHGSARVVTRYVRTAWLWDRVRVQGGAYGAFCMFDRLSGILTFVSYRDPNLERTLEAFDRTADFLENLNIREEELTKAVIGAIGDIDQYQLPDAKGYASMAYHLSGETDQERQIMREEVFGTTVEDFRVFGSHLRKSREGGIVKILGSPRAIGGYASASAGKMQVVKLL
ncbi:MAG: peptidase M16 [Desulfobacteraceae bacterium]|nr:MAG: peptidase M16 [Desulfobacteraceae bacterium]